MRNVASALLALVVVLALVAFVRGTEDVEDCGTVIAPGVFGHFQRESADPAVLAECDDLVDTRRIEVGIAMALVALGAVSAAALWLGERGRPLPPDPFAGT